jgi:diguanylate cyclase (GGDEF)-like protein
MNLFLRIDVNLIAFLILAVVRWIAQNHLNRHDLLNKAFLNVSLIVLVQLIFEGMCVAINGVNQPSLIFLSYLLHIGLFITAPILTLLWYQLVRRILDRHTKNHRSENILLMIPMLINFLLVVSSPWTGSIFSVTSLNVYQRGPLFWLSSAITYGYLFLGLLLLSISHRKIAQQDRFPLSVFAIFPLIGGLIQTMFYGTLLMWSSAAFSMVIAYTFLQHRLVSLDPLTQAWTRQSLYNYIDQRYLKLNQTDFGMIYLDVDDLKPINDTYGHMEGDEALKTAIRLVRESIRKNDIVARVGGDEFVVLFEGCEIDVLKRNVARIRERFNAFNASAVKPYPLLCSFGYDLYHPEFTGINQLIERVDALMYQDKRAKKKSSAVFESSADTISS